jgi:NAD(P)-dependent dehydrogenase (short-subunit alcohol dehydrogenase family)
MTDQKVAIVTGGSSGIGRATAVALAKEGVKVMVAARRAKEGEETVHLVKEAGSEDKVDAAFTLQEIAGQETAEEFQRSLKTVASTAS